MNPDKMKLGLHLELFYGRAKLKNTRSIGNDRVIELKKFSLASFIYTLDVGKPEWNSKSGAGLPPAEGRI